MVLLTVLMTVILHLTDCSLANSTYPIDTSKVVVNDAFQGSVSRDLGPCTCDMTFERCDVSCACDPDCSQEEIALFSSVVSSTAATTDFVKCVDSSLFRANQRQDLIYTFVDNMLCVKETNNPVTGTYYEAYPTKITSGMFDDYRAMEPFSFQISRSPDPIYSTIKYRTGFPIVSARKNSLQQLVPYGLGFLPMPSTGFTNECNDASFALFEQDVSTVCSRSLSPLSSACTGILSSATYTTNMFVGMTATASPEVPSGYLSVNVTSIFYEDPVTKVRTPVANVPVPVYVNASCVCTNAIVGVSYNIGYSKSGQISFVRASLKVSNVTASGKCSPSASAKVEQTFSTTFIRDWVQIDDSRPKSGNPGYLPGYPLLAGQKVILNGREFIEQQVNGLTLHASSTSSCSLLESDRIVVGFGESLLSSCLIHLSATELETMCRAGKISDYLNVLDPLYLGQWGNSSYNNPSEWVFVTKDDPPSSFIWSSIRNSCIGVVDSLQIEVLTGFLGSVSNPQSTIVAARVKYGTTTWQMRTVTDSERQSFLIKVSVTFISLPEGGLTSVTPPAPPMVPYLPDDVLYPLSV
uniref:Uncharacterized protein n=1 Tax=Spongospora subterranea TaxID=70186 RepID=A0A0H5R3V9_9EUKA|eukprot:CRZ08542.1 hypothetical protein [Spongospora subterranea]